MSWSEKEMATKKQMDYIDNWKNENTDLNSDYLMQGNEVPIW